MFVSLGGMCKMNDKRQEYLHLVNDKKLIGELLPKKNDLNRFELWKKKMCKRKFQAFILVSFLIIFVFTIIFISMIETEVKSVNVIGLIIYLLLFLYVDFIILKDFLNIKQWQMEYCNYGNVLDKYYKKNALLMQLH